MNREHDLAPWGLCNIEQAGLFWMLAVAPWRIVKGPLNFSGGYR